MRDLQANAPFMGNLTPSTTLAMTAKAKKLKAEDKDVLSMSAGEPDFDTPAHISAAAAKALNEGKTKYTPASGELALRQAVADKLVKDNAVPATAATVIVAPGAKYSCFTAVAALCGQGDEVIIPTPFWVSYPEMVAMAGAKSVFLPTSPANNYEVVPAELEAAITPRTKLLVLNSPSNPTGAVYRKATLEKIAAIAVKHNIMVMADEIYEKLTYDADFPHVSIASLGKEIAALTVTINGFSKAYSMTGWRLGYLAGPEWLVKRIDALQSHTTSNPTTFAQYGAIAALTGPQGPVEEMRLAFAKRRDLIYGLMSSIPGVKCVRPQGAFYILCDISSFGVLSLPFCERLLAEGLVAAVPGDAFGAEGTIRLSYACSEEHIKKACERIQKFTESL